MSVGVIFDSGLCCPDDLDQAGWTDYAAGGISLEDVPLATFTVDRWESPAAEEVLGVCHEVGALISEVDDFGPTVFDRLTASDRSALTQAGSLIDRVTKRLRQQASSGPQTPTTADDQP